MHPTRNRSAIVAALIAWLAPSLAGAAEGGLVLIPDPALLIALIVLFLALIVPVNALVLKPLLRVLDEREARIAGTRVKAEKLEQDAAAVLLRYEQAIHAMREEGERSRRSVLTQVREETQREITGARREAERRLEQARTEISASLGSARDGLRNEARDLARQAASQVLGRAL